MQRNGCQVISLLWQALPTDHNGIRGFIRRIKPDKNDTAKVWLESVAIDKWLLWLTELQNKRIVVTASNVSRAKKRRINIRMALIRP